MPNRRLTDAQQADSPGGELHDLPGGELHVYPGEQDGESDPVLVQHSARHTRVAHLRQAGRVSTDTGWYKLTPGTNTRM